MPAHRVGRLHYLPLGEEIEDCQMLSALLVKADRWLYQAKERGRNRVCGPVLAAA